MNKSRFVLEYLIDYDNLKLILTGKYSLNFHINIHESGNSACFRSKISLSTKTFEEFAVTVTL